MHLPQEDRCNWYVRRFFHRAAVASIDTSAAWSIFDNRLSRCACSRDKSCISWVSRVCPIRYILISLMLWFANTVRGIGSTGFDDGAGGGGLVGNAGCSGGAGVDGGAGSEVGAVTACTFKANRSLTVWDQEPLSWHPVTSMTVRGDCWKRSRNMIFQPIVGLSPPSFPRRTKYHIYVRMVLSHICMENSNFNIVVFYLRLEC